MRAKTFVNRRKERISRRRLSRIANQEYGLGPTLRKFVDKTFVEGGNTAKVFSYIIWYYSMEDDDTHTHTPHTLIHIHTRKHYVQSTRIHNVMII